MISNPVQEVQEVQINQSLYEKKKPGSELTDLLKPQAVKQNYSPKDFGFLYKNAYDLKVSVRT